tara:strand:- start:477 stop:728 length:252 start_codon:yes stop_codon:yes gene_type:complete
MSGPGDETTPPGSPPMTVPPSEGGPVPGAPEPQPLPGALPGSTSSLESASADGAASTGGDKIDMILAVVAFLVTVGFVIILLI